MKPDAPDAVAASHSPAASSVDEDVARFLYAVANAPVKRWPYRHFVASDAIDRAWAEELRSLPLGDRLRQLSSQRRTGVDPNRYVLNLMPDDPGDLPPPIARLRSLFNTPLVAQTLFDIFRDVIRQRMRQGEDGYRLRRSLDVVEDRTGYRLTPHTDHRAKLVTAIMYLDDEPDGVPLGTSIYVPTQPMPDARASFLESPRHHDRSLFTHVTTVPHRAGSVFCFAPVPNSFHGVEPLEHPGARRFLAQFQVLALNDDDLVR